MFNVPISELFPNNFAGIVVKASNALFLSNPYLIAFIKLPLKSLADFKSAVVKANVTPFLLSITGFVGDWFQERMSSNSTCDAICGSLTSNGF